MKELTCDNCEKMLLQNQKATDDINIYTRNIYNGIEHRYYCKQCVLEIHHELLADGWGEDVQINEGEGV